MFTQPSSLADPTVGTQSLPFLRITECDDDQQGRNPLNVPGGARRAGRSGTRADCTTEGTRP